ncbi:MAG TPA: MFS transporter, partial [Thermomicrobiales bacterium]
MRRRSVDRTGVVPEAADGAGASGHEQADGQVQPFPEGRARWVLAAALLAVFVGSLDLTVIATLLPKIVSDLQINTADINRYVWVVSGYLLAYMVTIPVLGRVSDILGRRPVFAGALAIFLVGSILSARAGGLAGLITGRAIQGFGGGALVPVTMALVGDILPPRRRAAVIGLVGA